MLLYQRQKSWFVILATNVGHSKLSEISYLENVATLLLLIAKLFTFEINHTFMIDSESLLLILKAESMFIQTDALVLMSF